jgi:ABC-2 type transport system permease protein
LLSALFLLPEYLATKHEDYENIRIGIVDDSNTFKNTFNESKFRVEILENKTIDDINSLISKDEYEGIVYIESSDSAMTKVKYYSVKQPSIFLDNQIKSAFQTAKLNESLLVYGIQNIDSIIRASNKSISIENVKVGMNTGSTDSNLKRMLCLAMGMTIYLFIFLFSSQVMRGVSEEKSNRIVELIITSISPVKFMAGKIIGIALLGLTQIFVWIVIIYMITFAFSGFIDVSSAGMQNNLLSQRINPEDINAILTNFGSIDFNVIIPTFIFFFIAGYLLYSSVFAAIAASVGNSDELQQITTLITAPLILSVLVLTNTINNPDSALSFWFSIIPFTSPVIMSGRMVYGVPFQEILLSVFLLIITTACITWLSGKIYKSAVLYTGKKVRFSDLTKWIKNTNI